MSEWLKETGCKPVGSAYAGSNPAPPTVRRIAVEVDLPVESGGQPPTAQEIMHLRDALPPLGVPVDVIVMSEDLVRRRKDVPGSLVYWAMREARLVAES
jgi:hypothetical protein